MNSEGSFQETLRTFTKEGLFGNALNLFKNMREKDSKLEKGPKVQLHSHFDADKYLEYHFTGPLIIGSNKD
jgi:hypothetical protein